MQSVLIDTNILIGREDLLQVSSDIQDIFSLLSKLKYQVIVHPKSLEDLDNDKEKERREIVKSKVKSYNFLETPPLPNKEFLDMLNVKDNDHDLIDAHLLFALQRDCTDFLLTDDKGIHKNSRALGLDDRVYNTADLKEMLLAEEKKLTVSTSEPPMLKLIPVNNIDVNTEFFDILREDYGEKGFSNWWSKICLQKRKAYTYYQGNSLEAFLLLKEENEPIEGNPVIKKGLRLKIATLKVKAVGFRLGELFLKLAFEYARKKNISEVYLTHFEKPGDRLVQLIKEYGFREVSQKKSGEKIYLKWMKPPKGKKANYLLVRRLCYPTIYDSESKSKYLIPIKPEFHQKLFTSYRERQTTLSEYRGEFIIEGNAIKKAYLCHSKNTRMQEGDILLFYQSSPMKKITTMGVIDRVYNKLSDPLEISKHVKKRTVYSNEEIEEISKKETKVILFKFHFHLENPLTYDDLLKKGIIKGPIQSIQSLEHKKYLKLKRISKLPEEFFVWE